MGNPFMLVPSQSNVGRLRMRPDRVEDVPAKGRLGQHDRRERAAVVLHDVAKALRRASHDQRQEAWSRTAERPQEDQYLLVFEIVRKDDCRRRQLGGDEREVLDAARAVRRNAGAAEIGMKAVERLGVRRNDRDVDSGLPSRMGRNHDGPTQQTRCRLGISGSGFVVAGREAPGPHDAPDWRS